MASILWSLRHTFDKQPLHTPVSMKAPVTTVTSHYVSTNTNTRSCTFVWKVYSDNNKPFPHTSVSKHLFNSCNVTVQMYIKIAEFFLENTTFNKPTIYTYIIPIYTYYNHNATIMLSSLQFLFYYNCFHIIGFYANLVYKSHCLWVVSCMLLSPTGSHPFPVETSSRTVYC